MCVTAPAREAVLPCCPVGSYPGIASGSGFVGGGALWNAPAAVPKITIRVANPGKQEAQVLSELSTGNLFIRADKFLPLGSEVQVDLHLPSASEMLPLRAKVARIVDDDAARARKASGMGLAVDLSHEPIRSRFAALLTQHHLPVNLPPAAPTPQASATPPPPPPSAKRPNGRQNGAIAIPLPGSVAPPPADARPSLPPADEADLHPAASAPSSAANGTNGSSLPSDWPASWADLVKDTPRPAEAKPAPFPFARAEPQAAQAVPLPGPVPVAPVASAPPPMPDPVAPAAPAAPAVDIQALEARMQELEKSLAEARNLAMRAESARETAAGDHELVVKRLYEEIAAVRAQKLAAPPPPALSAPPAAAPRRSATMPALFGLVIGAAAVVAVLLFVPDARSMLGLSSPPPVVPQPPPVAVTPPPEPEPAPVAQAKPAPEPLAAATEPGAEAKPEPVAEVKPAPVAEVKPEPVVEVKPAPVAEVKPASSVKPATYGKLNLRSDYPATVYVNGRRAGRAPLSGVRAKSGKVYVRFDCVVEDTLMRGKSRTVNLDEDGVVTIDHACVE